MTKSNVIDVNDVVQVDNIFGQKITVFRNDLIGRNIIKKGIYDKVAVLFIDHLLKNIPDSVCLDIGANIGNHCLVMARHAKTVYSFEPQLYVYNLLAKNIADNQLGNVLANQFGLSESNDTLTIYIVDENNLGASSFLDNSSKAGIEASVKRGDDVVKELKVSKIDLIKIDVEGYESKVIRGLTDSIKNYKPIILMEWNSLSNRVEFKEHNIFSATLANYNVYALESSHNSDRFTKSKLGKTKKKLVRRYVPIKFFLEQFQYKKDYGNILLVPAEKDKWVKQVFE
jgi:FkbM family methyltransferase